MQIQPFHKLWRLLPPYQRRFYLSKVGGILAPSISSEPFCDQSVIIIGEFSKASGLGEGARIMYNALKNENVTVQKIDIDPYGFSYTKYKEARRILSVYPYASLIFHINAPQLAFALLNLPRFLLKNRKIIGYWAWELEILPKEWEVGFRFVHEIWVPSRFVAKAVKHWANKYQKKITVVPHPIAAYPVAIASGLTRESLGLPQATLNILTSFNLSSSFVRKNPIAAIRAFRKACETIAHDKISLILKVSYINDFRQDFNELKKAIDGQKNIILYTNLLTTEENRALIFHSDIILSLHRSEGFGLVPAEAMQYGKAVISTNWSATSEYIDENCGAPVNYKLIPVKDPRKVYELPNALWAEPDIEFAAKKINELFYNENYRNNLGVLSKNKIKTIFNSKFLKKRFNNYLVRNNG